MFPRNQAGKSRIWDILLDNSVYAAYQWHDWKMNRKVMGGEKELLSNKWD